MLDMQGTVCFATLDMQDKGERKGERMDPNQAFADIRESVESARAASGEDVDSQVRDEALCYIAESFVALDEWLSRGGFLPSARVAK